jgi:ketosteroid isomerase-like protein
MGQLSELMARGTEIVLSGDLESLREIYADDAVVTTPDAGELHGIDAIIEWNRMLLDPFSDKEFRSERLLETEECAIEQGEFVGTHTQPLRLPDGQTVPPTGKQVRLRAADVATVRDGKVVRHDFYFDQLDLLVQLGLVETSAATEG